eukprot:2688898-Rhodomonas_salina.1
MRMRMTLQSRAWTLRERVCVCERERDSAREREIAGYTDARTHGQTHKTHRHRHTDTQTHRHTDTARQTHTKGMPPASLRRVFPRLRSKQRHAAAVCPPRRASLVLSRSRNALHLHALLLTCALKS